MSVVICHLKLTVQSAQEIRSCTTNDNNQTSYTDNERHKDNRGWESTSIPLQWADPLTLLAVPGTPQVGKIFFLDEKCPVRGFESVAPTSLAWKDKVGRYEVKLTQGLAVSRHTQYNWTIPSGTWTHRRSLFRREPEELVRAFHNERLRQEALEKTGHCSPKWTVLRSLQKVYGARKIRGCTILDSPLFFESAGREESTDLTNKDTTGEGSVPNQEERGSPIFWGDNQGPVVMVWDVALSCSPGSRRVQRRSSPTTTTGLSVGSNPHEVLWESRWQRIDNSR